MTRVLVTGAAGFIGSTLAGKILSETDWHVLGVDALAPYYDVSRKRANIASLDTSRFHFVEDDLATLDARALLGSVDVVFHLAAQPGVRGSWGTQFDSYLRNNVLVTQRLLEAAAGITALRAFVYASSSSVYGDALSYPTHESDATAPKSPYGVSKLAAEHLCSLYATNHAVPTRSLRFFTVYGPRQRPDMAFDRFIRAACKSEPIDVYGDGHQIREFTYVDDIARALLLAAEKDVTPGSVINLSGGSSVSVLDVVEQLERLLDRHINVRHLPPALGDVFRTGGNSERARRLLGWAPEIDLSEGLARQVAWTREAPALTQR